MGDVLILGTWFRFVPEYVKNTKSPTSVDVVEQDSEIVSIVNWMHSDINVITHDEWTYSTTKLYDLILVDIFAEPNDVSDDHKTALRNNYINNLKTDGKLLIQISGDIIT